MKKRELKRIGKFAFWGAIGFGIGGIIGYLISWQISIWGGSYIRYIISAIIGLASLGFALKYWRYWKKSLCFLITGAISSWLLGELYYRVGSLIFMPWVIGWTIGGASLGLMLGGWIMAGVLALTGAMGFGIGWVISLWIWQILFGWSEPGIAAFSLMGAVQGAFVGLSLGVALKGGRLAIVVALSTALMTTIFMIFPNLDIVFSQIFWATVGVVWLGLVIKDWGNSGSLVLASAIAFSVAGTVRLVAGEALSSQLNGWESLIAMAIWGLVGGALLGIALEYLKGTWSSINTKYD